MLLNTRKQQMLSVDSVVVVTRKQSRAIKRILADNRAALDADFAEFGTMDASCARARRALRVVSFPSHEFSKVLFEKTHCLFTKNRALTPDLKPIARECCVAASTTSDIDVDGRRSCCRRAVVRTVRTVRTAPATHVVCTAARCRAEGRGDAPRCGGRARSASRPTR